MTAKVYTEHKVERDRIDRCPVCGNTECTLQDHDYNGKEYVEFYTCDACEQEFTEVYEYKQTEYSKEA